MKGKKTVLIIFICTTAVVLLMIFAISIFPHRKWEGRMISPFSGITQRASPSAVVVPGSPQAPKTFKFDESTDLKMELDKVNPQVLDSDFE